MGTTKRLLGAKECFIQDGGRPSVTKQSTEWTIDVAGNMSLNGRPISGDADALKRQAMLGGNTDSSMVLLAGAMAPHQFMGFVMDVAEFEPLASDRGD